MPNVFEPEWDMERDEGALRFRRAYVGRQAGSRQLGASLFELAPGGAASAMHAHFANEELIVVLSGRPSLRERDGERQLEPGDAVACLPGRGGAHAVVNRTDEPARVLIASTMLSPEINEMLDDGTYWLRDYAPGEAPDGPELDVRLRDEP